MTLITSAEKTFEVKKALVFSSFRCGRAIDFPFSCLNE